MGLLDIFNSSSDGLKQFCGKTIYLDFYHILEAPFINLNLLNTAPLEESIYPSDSISELNNSESGDY